MPGLLHARVLLVLGGAIALPQAFAQTLPASVVACADETDVLKRLACYDREVARYRTPPVAATAPRGPAAVTSSPAAPAASTTSLPSSPVTSAPAAAPPSNASASESAAADFGMNGELKRKESGGASEPPKLDKLTARLTAVSSIPTGAAIYSLEGGQVWVEAETESHLPLHVGEEVTIKRGVLGAFYLSSAEVRGLRVKRVR